MTGEEKADNKTLGEIGEAIAVTFLKGLKFSILERNFRCKCGEIDIIARDGKTIVFVEVKTRRNAAFGVPQLAVTSFKQRQISKAALTWLAQKKMHDAAARFDVIAIVQRNHAVPEIEHIMNAFDLAY
ncbi:YraN family protein [Geotalea sp. SG265]|uniref:YraN family protein n=1 Tax=Geotalea sp. SG265 TaxID=2922867 RepID=UPI001FAEDB94